MQNVTTIEVPFTLEQMHKDMFDEPLESVCDDLADKSPQCFTTKFIDKNKKTILFYFGLRHPDPKERNRVSPTSNSNSNFHLKP